MKGYIMGLAASSVRLNLLTSRINQLTCDIQNLNNTKLGYAMAKQGLANDYYKAISNKVGGYVDQNGRNMKLTYNNLTRPMGSNHSQYRILNEYGYRVVPEIPDAATPLDIERVTSASFVYESGYVEEVTGQSALYLLCTAITNYNHGSQPYGHCTGLINLELSNDLDFTYDDFNQLYHSGNFVNYYVTDGEIVYVDSNVNSQSYLLNMLNGEEQSGDDVNPHYTLEESDDQNDWTQITLTDIGHDILDTSDDEAAEAFYKRCTLEITNVETMIDNQKNNLEIQKKAAETEVDEVKKAITNVIEKLKGWG